MQFTRPPAGPSRVFEVGFRRFRLPLELVLVAVLAVMALTVNIAQPPLVDWDEATYAQVAHEALTSHHFLDLTWNGASYVKKPPLLFWTVTASFRAFGESEVSARLPSVIAGAGTLILVYLLAMPVIGRLGGLLAAVIPLEFYFFVARGGRECATDAPLIFFSTLAIYAASRARDRRGWLLLSGAACGLAIMSKGLAGVLPLSVIAVALLIIPGFSEAGLGALAWVAGGTVLAAGPWYIYEALFNYPAFLSSFIGYETVRRVTTHLEDDQLESEFPLLTFARELRHLWPLALPLAALLIQRLRSGLTTALRSMPSEILLWIAWLAITLAAACAVQTHLPWYVLPALIPAALLAASIPAYALRDDGIRRVAGALALIALIIVGLDAPRRWRAINLTLSRQRALSLPSYHLGLKAREANPPGAGGELFFAGVPLPTLVYYSRSRCNFVETSELAHVELVGAASVPPTIRYHDLVLLDSSGRAQVIGNLGQEWHWTYDSEEYYH